MTFRSARVATGHWVRVLERHPDPTVNGPLPGWVYLDTLERVRHVARTQLTFWYDPPGVAMTDAELALLRSIPTDEAMAVKVDGKAFADAKALERELSTGRRNGQPKAGSLSAGGDCA